MPSLRPAYASVLRLSFQDRPVPKDMREPKQNLGRAWWGCGLGSPSYHIQETGAEPGSQPPSKQVLFIIRETQGCPFPPQAHSGSLPDIGVHTSATLPTGSCFCTPACLSVDMSQPPDNPVLGVCRRLPAVPGLGVGT